MNQENARNSSELAEQLNINLPQQIANLIGRDDVVNQITDVLSSADAGVHMQLVGIGGVGKTAICRYIAHHLSEHLGDDFGDAVWVSCQAGIMEQLSNFVAPKYNVAVEDPTTWIYELIEVINTRKKPMVVFLDNLEAEQVAGAEFRQLKRLNCHIVATSREVFSDQFSQVFDINALHKQHCKALFEQYYDGDIDCNKTLERLLKRAGYHTLTIELLAKIATSGLLTVDELLTKITDCGFDLSDWDIAVSGEHSGATGDKALQLQLQEHLSKLFRLDELSELQQQSLYLLSILPHIAYHGREELMPWLDVPGTMLTGLADKGWLQRNKSKFGLHPVIASVVRQNVSVDDCVTFAFIRRVNDCIEPNENQHWAEKAHYLPQLETMVNYLDALMVNDRELDDYDIAKADVMVSEAQINLVYINYDKAIKLYNLALSLYHHVYGEKHNTVAECFNYLALTLRQKGNNQQALKFYRQALRICMLNHGAEHPKTAGILNNIAVVYHQESKYQEALEHFFKVVEIQQNVLPRSHPHIASTFNNIGSVYYEQHDHRQALSYQQQALDIFKQTLTPLNPNLAVIHQNIAVSYYYLKEPTQALDHILKARFVCINSLFDEHPHNKKCQDWLDRIVNVLGGYDKNAALIEQIEAELDEEYEGIELGRE